MKRSNSTKGESGQVLVILAFFMIALLAVMALVLDGGNVFLQRRRMQNAADAGALAGTRILALEGTFDEARAAAYQYAVTRNGADSADITIDATGLAVVACENVTMTFARVLGVNTMNVCARAGAYFGPIGEAVGLGPIAIRDFEYLFDTPYVIWDDDTDRDPTSGYISGSYRGWLNLACIYPMNCAAAGATDLKEWMHDGYPAAVKVNQWIRGDGGVKAAVIQQASVGQLLKIPVYDTIQNMYGNESYYRVVKFVAFRVTQVYATGYPKGIRGTFEHYFTPGPPTGDQDGGWSSIDLNQ